MAKYKRRIHTIDTNHKPTIVALLSHLRADKAHVTMFDELETSASIISVVTEWREKKA